MIKIRAGTTAQRKELFNAVADLLAVDTVGCTALLVPSAFAEAGRMATVGMLHLNFLFSEAPR